jgi:lysophospholipase L1-like esterase
MAELSAILCLGDSLTAGYIDGVATAPYTDRCAERLESLGAKVLLTNAGVPGELSSQMGKRLLSELRHGPRYDIVLILAGTNDILRKHPPDRTAAMVSQLHQIAWDAGVRTGVMSIPPVCLVGSTQLALLEEYRTKINRKLKELAVMNRHRTVFIDVAALVPLSNPALWSSDGVHLTRAGYETIGNFIAEM